MRHVTLNQCIYAFRNSIEVALKNIPNLILAFIVLTLFCFVFYGGCVAVMAAVNIPKDQTLLTAKIICFTFMGLIAFGMPDLFSSVLFRNKKIRYSSLLEVLNSKAYALKLLILLIFYVLAMIPFWLVAKNFALNLSGFGSSILISAVTSIIFTVFFLASFYTAPNGRGLSLFTAVSKGLETTFTNLPVLAVIYVTNILCFALFYGSLHILGLTVSLIISLVSGIIIGSAQLIFLCKIGYYVVPESDNRNRAISAE